MITYKCTSSALRRKKWAISDTLFNKQALGTRVTTTITVKVRSNFLCSDLKKEQSTMVEMKTRHRTAWYILSYQDSNNGIDTIKLRNQ